MAVASGPAGPVLAGPLSVFAFKTAHVQMINNMVINFAQCMDVALAARVTIKPACEYNSYSDKH